MEGQQGGNRRNKSVLVYIRLRRRSSRSSLTETDVTLSLRRTLCSDRAGKSQILRLKLVSIQQAQTPFRLLFRQPHWPYEDLEDNVITWLEEVRTCGASSVLDMATKGQSASPSPSIQIPDGRLSGISPASYGSDSVDTSAEEAAIQADEDGANVQETEAREKGDV